MAIEYGFKAEEAQAYSILGDFNQELGNYKLAITNFYKAETILQVSRTIKNTLISVYTKVGACHDRLGETDKAIKAWKKRRTYLLISLIRAVSRLV